jgi:carboxymethylenebutenolidase
VIDTATGAMRMLMTRPDGGSAGPGLLLIPEAFGLTEHMQDVAGRFAEEGFASLTPDLYHRLGVRQVAYAEPSAAEKVRERLTDQEVMDDLDLALRFLGARGEVRSGLVAAVGYGAGARDAFRLATRNGDVLALVCYSGPVADDSPSAPIRDAQRLLAPSLLFFGEADDRIPTSHVERVGQVLSSLGKEHEIVSYPGARHGFFCSARAADYAVAAAEEAWTRTVDFLYERLEG